MTKTVNELAVSNFIDNAETYAELKAFWQQSIEDLTNEKSQSYVHNFYSNGIEIMDGNPIFSTLVQKTRGIRIIQTEGNSPGPLLVTWFNELFLDHKLIKELVISVQLIEETFNEVKLLIILFLEGNLTEEMLDVVNGKFRASE